MISKTFDYSGNANMGKMLWTPPFMAIAGAKFT